MNFQSVVMNVEDLDRSIEFYRDVFGFSLVSTKDQVAVLSAPGSERAQVLVLRSIASSGVRRVGAGHVGMRAIVLEVDSLNELDRISEALDKRGCLLARHGDDATWTSVFGRDPDQIGLVAGASLTSGPIPVEAWTDFSDAIYALGE